MGADCCDHSTLLDPHRGNPAYRRVLWAVLAINARGMYERWMRNRERIKGEHGERVW
jgi:hypothetical protein